MAYESVLSILAEVSAAFVGFSMLASVFRGSDGPRTPRMFAFRDVAEIGLITLTASLVPLTALAHGAESSTVWRGASVLFALLFGLGLRGSLRRRGSMLKHAMTTRPLFAATTRVLSTSVLILLTINIVHPNTNSGTCYMIGIELALAIAGLSFVWAAFDSDREPDAAQQGVEPDVE